MITSEVFKKYLDFAQSAYQDYNVTDQAYRQGGRVPYSTHPLGSALLLLADTDIPYEKRELGFKILVLHDVLEDTSLSLPEWVEAAVKQGVEEMTYTGAESLEEKIQWANAKDTFIKLLMLYDGFWSLYEKHIGESVERKELWRRSIASLADEVEQNWGTVRIVQISRAVAENTKRSKDSS